MISRNDQALRRNLAWMLEQYASDQASAQFAAHVARGRRRHTFRYAPSGFHDGTARDAGKARRTVFGA